MSPRESSLTIGQGVEMGLLRERPKTPMLMR